jgi:hypothetical protein
MKFIRWVEQGYAKLDWSDMAMVKFSSILFGLLLAKIWPPILDLDWYWYLILVVIVAYKPTMKFFCSKAAKKH